MSNLKIALLVIDAQQSFQHRPYWNQSDAEVFCARLQILVDEAKARGIPVVQVFHLEEEGVFSLASGFIKPLASLSIAPDLVIHKHKHSALIGSSLPVWLVEHGIQRLIVSGIRTEQCCETTTRHASDSGYAVDFASEATLTFAMTDRNGRTWSADEIKQRTELVLDGRFARIVSIQQLLADLDEVTAAKRSRAA